MVCSNGIHMLATSASYFFSKKPEGDLSRRIKGMGRAGGGGKDLKKGTTHLEPSVS